jgi:hypothetical protein
VNPGIRNCVASFALLWVMLLAGNPPLLAAMKLIPSTMCRGLFVVPATWKDETLQLILDTGADGWSLDPDGIERVSGKRLRHGKKVTLRKGELGHLKLKKIKARVHEMDHLALALGTHIDGIVGFNTFDDLLLTLDYKAEEVRVGQGALPQVDGVEVFEDYGKSRPFIALDLGDERVPLLIDSGFAGGIDLNLKDPLTWQTKPSLVEASVRYSEVVLQSAGRLDVNLKVGPLLLERPTVRVSDGTRLLGVEVLQHMQLTFDKRNQRIRMIPYDQSVVKFEPFRSWGLGFRPRTNGMEITGVFSGTPAQAAGIKVGDLLTAINGVPIHERGCRSINDPQPLSARLSIVSDGEKKEIELETAILIP